MALARGPVRPMAWACAAPLCAGVLLIVQAWLLARVLGGVVQTGMSGQVMQMWWREFVAMAALVLARAVISGWGEHAGVIASEQIKAGLRRALFAAMLDGGPQWTRARASGELAGAMLEHVEALDGFFSRYLPAMIAATVLPLAFAVVLMPVDVVAGLLLLVTAPLIPLFMALVGWGAQAAGRRHARSMTRLAGFFADRLRGAATLKMFGREQAETQTVADAAKGLAQRTQAVLRIAFLSSAVLEFFAALGVAGMAVYFGLSFLGFLNLRGDPITLQIGLFCLLMAPEAYAPLRQFAAHYHDRSTAQAAVSELARVFGQLPDVRAVAGDAAIPADAQAMVQADADDCVLRLRQHDLIMGVRRIGGIDLILRQGEHLALMGVSGVGKTTLLETIAGLRGDVPDDALTLFDRPLAQWSRADLCTRVAYMGQRPYLFEGTLADNIRVGRADADDRVVRVAAQRACVTEFCDDWPDGLNTRLGPRGQGLSGGQAHRVALARLYLRDPALVLVDEPTAHLDEHTGQRVLDALLSWCEGRALIVVTHADSVAQRCHRQVLMDADGVHPT
ncbi:MAG: thiol reductant ABC exporter subunit CydD [Burkholderiaceae bacterium]